MLGQESKFRICLDPRHINAKLYNDGHPLPLLSILQHFRNAKYFSTLDLEQSFHRFRIRLEDQPKTAFTCMERYPLHGHVHWSTLGSENLNSCFSACDLKTFQCVLSTDSLICG
eukprot:Pompholyxophrys_punicea_v1_NODE_456_length_1915_cov_6.565054.p1 type:complete len:114 gc:universal NODE_456_length_1915_cov_6.565054:796-1137(+)